MDTTTPRHRYRPHRRSRPGSLAAEDQPGYRAVDGSAVGAADDVVAAAAEGQVPFGSPVLDGLPELAAVLQDLVAGDRLLVRAVVGLVPLVEDDRVDGLAQVGLEHWVGIVARQTRMDRRLLLRMCRRLNRYPKLLAGAREGQVSFAQLRGILLALRDVRLEFDDHVDARLGGALEHLDGPVDPDVLVEQVAAAVSELDAVDLAVEERSARRDRFLYLQPTLDRTGVKVSGSYDAVGGALLDEATFPRPNQLSDERSLGQIRADNLLEWLTHTCPSHGGGPAAGDNDHPAGDDDQLPTALDASAVAIQATTPLSRADGSMPRVQLAVRIELDSLLDRSQIPAAILTRLVGGKLWLTSEAARRLVDDRGADLRSVVLQDTGEVVGVGRARANPPRWLATVAPALHDTCTEPLCDRPARGAELDHARPWWPSSPDQPHGTTDVANIGPLCASTNRSKEAAGWRATQTAAGLRRWTHPVTGLEVTTVPATWRPPGLVDRQPRPRGDP